MYDFVDRPITSLDHGGRFLVWSMRCWVTAMDRKVCPGSILARAFDKWNMLPGLQPFLRMMALLNRHGLENFEFCALACNHVSEHEAIFIGLVCSIHEEQPVSAQRTLELLVEEESLGDLLATLSVVGRAMKAAAIYPARPGCISSTDILGSERSGS